MKEFTIQQNEENQRLDKYLKKLLPNASTGFLYKMLRKKNIVYNGRKAAGNELLKAGDKVAFYFSDETFAKFHQDMDALQQEYQALAALPMKGLSLIYEDEDILVLNKPAGLLSQKAAEGDCSANECMLGYLIRSGALSLETFSTFRPSVCNRLDQNTTGLLLAGKSLKGLQELSQLLRDRRLKKYYYALVLGCVEEEAHVCGYLKKDEAANRVIVRSADLCSPGLENERRIETAYRPLAHSDHATLLEVHLITGKTHQIRAHLAALGHPIMGDPKYGDKKANENCRRDFQVRHQLLHAQRVEFPDGRVFCAPLPSSFEKVLSATVQPSVDISQLF